METTSVISKPKKKQKLNEEENIDGNNKCLVNLPEEILLHILSFLKTKDAVRTSVLCKRWEYLWASIPNLDFNQLHSSPAKRKRKRTLFMKFVERALSLRDSSFIERFTLRCDVLSDVSCVNMWISAAISHNVQELYIELENFEGDFSLPHCLFTSKTLTSLGLYMCCILKLPTTICFSNLKFLRIGKVTFSDEYLTQQFFSGLPVLEELELNGCSWVGLKVVRISAPKLHSMSIFEFESYEDGGCQVMIFGVSLKKFHYSGLLSSEYCLYESLSLEKACIYLETKNTSEQIAHRVYKLLSGLSNVEVLGLSSKAVKVLIYAAELLPNIPMFNNLVDLKLTVNEMSMDLDHEALLEILQRSPCLENLEFWTGGLTANCEEDDRILDPVPPCFLSHLKRIKVNCYDGDENKLSAIKILLKKAVVLEKIVIFISVYPAQKFDNLVKFCKQLIELPRGSQNCKIVLKWYDCSGEMSKKCRIVL